MQYDDDDDENMMMKKSCYSKTSARVKRGFELEIGQDYLSAKILNITQILLTVDI